jgi:hypothetical protein
VEKGGHTVLEICPMSDPTPFHPRHIDIAIDSIGTADVENLEWIPKRSDSMPRAVAPSVGDIFEEKRRVFHIGSDPRPVEYGDISEGNEIVFGNQNLPIACFRSAKRMRRPTIKPQSRGTE